MENKNGNDKHEYSQNHSGEGDNVLGNKIVNHFSGNTETPKELTFVPKTNPANIIGRGKELDKLHQLLFDNQQVVVARGMGGIGKTTLASAYVFKYYEAYKKIVWITQDDRDISHDFVQNKELLQSLKIASEGKDVRELFNEILFQLNQISAHPKLLVIDNAFQSIETHLGRMPAQPNWHLLLTSRAEIAGLKILKLGFLTIAEGVQLFKTHCHRIKDEPAITEIVKLVEQHTLTIEILAKTAELQKYDLSTLKKALEEDLRANVKTGHHKHKQVDKITSYLSTLFNLSRLSEHEKWLLKQFTCLPPEAHSFDLLKELLVPAGHPIKLMFAETLEGLAAKGWLIKAEKQEEYKLHRVINEVSSFNMEITYEDLGNLIKQITSKLGLDHTKDNPIDKFIWAPYGRLLLKKSQPFTNNNIATLQNNLALTLKALGDYREAKELMEKALLSAEKNYGSDHPTTAIRYSNLALILRALGDYSGAKELIEKALLSDEKNFGPEHPNTARRYSILANILKDLGDYSGAKELIEKAIVSDEKNYGPDHPTTAIRYSNLALILRALGDYSGAKELIEKALLSAEKNFGPDHPTTVINYSNLANILRDLGDYSGAKELIEKAIVSDEKNYGPDHPSTAARYSTLADTLKDLGDYVGAKALMEKALLSAEKNFGPDHPTTSRRYSNLALILQSLKDYEGAKTLMEKALLSDEKSFGNEHPTTAIRYSNLALILQDLGDYTGAKTLMEKAMVSDEKNFGPDHPTTARRYSNLALILKALGNNVGAKALMEKALRSNEKSFGGDHPKTAIRYWNLASILQSLGDLSTALENAQTSLNVFKKVFPKDHPYISGNIKTINRIKAAMKK